MKRRKSQLKLARKRAGKRIATNDTLKARAQKASRRKVADHILRGRSKSSLSAAAKSRLEKQIDTRKGIVRQHFRRELPAARKRDRKK